MSLVPSSTTPLPSTSPSPSPVSAFFSFAPLSIQSSLNYIAHFIPRPQIFGYLNGTSDKSPGGGIAPNEVTDVLYKSLGIPLILTMAGCLLLFRTLYSSREGKKQPVVMLGKKPTLESDSGSSDNAGPSVKEKGETFDVYGRAINSYSDHLKRTDADDTDPGLLKKHSAHIAYTTPIATYPSIRTFLYPHPHIEKLPTEPSPLPLLVFIHGLGGSLSQFHPLLTSLVNVAPCFGIDLPGCGLSSFSPKSWEAYSVEALASLLAVAIEQYRDKKRGQKVVLIAHSLGCSLSALLASSESPVISSLREHVIGFVAICPIAGPLPEAENAKARKLLHVPDPLFDLFRRWDRLGGPNSHSVLRYVGKEADIETKNIQLRINKQSKTPVFRRMAWGSLPTYNNLGEPMGGIPGKKIWAGLQVPLLLVAGGSDEITKPEEATKILGYLNNECDDHIQSRFPASHLGGGNLGAQGDQADSNARASQDEGPVSDVSDGVNLSKSDKSASGEKRGIKAFTFPAPASHALLYDRHTCRTLSGLIQEFFPKHVDSRLSLGWQLQHLTTSGKWDVKNLEKWKAIKPVSDVMGDTFVAMKTLREVDEIHTPIPFAQKWRGKIYAVVDISHESPVYDPAQLEKGGIQYHKLPTVSKIPPTIDEVRDFITLVSGLEDEISAASKELPDGARRPVIGVHCHYGFNRTGFFVTSYLIEKKGFTVQGALDEFERCRSPGIKHEHFIDTLFVRYCVGLQRASTL
ncbi:hypothetical protein AJ79_00849 [Helicocarpus griseus UAMH5409]|uniref:Tyrosine specific protein phosphatases domain-containing protein n=1 Tax=Helicocarpus griseus UAMH5409 TaxID=1447875 RepID=A0A2B7Y9S6_9EURO|nr:hypothetical protein AJ79_00849 [Helicocarpus griseus UAMH5409]